MSIRLLESNNVTEQISERESTETHRQPETCQGQHRGHQKELQRESLEPVAIHAHTHTYTNWYILQPKHSKSSRMREGSSEVNTFLSVIPEQTPTSQRPHQEGQPDDH